MTQRTVKADDVKTLADWVARWPKAANLRFDPETREPTVYSNKDINTKVSSFPWKREADTLTILAQPQHYSAQAVEAATRRFGKIQETREQIRQTGHDQLRLAEAAVLAAWRAYRTAPPASRGPLRRDILTAEKAIIELEQSLAPTERIATSYNDVVRMYVPPMPYGNRGISVVAGGT